MSKPSSKPSVKKQGKPAHGDDERLIPVAVMGLGVIGLEIARAALQHPGLQLVGVIDQHPDLAGKKLSELLGLPGLELKVQRDLAALAGKLEGGALLLATHSRVDEVAPLLRVAFRAGASVVSTCEELAYPWLYHEALAAELDAAAQEAGVCVLGTGVNPGFVLDRLVATAGALTGKVQRAIVERVVDVRTRREALQLKVGVGLSEAEFQARVEADTIGHLGLAESCALAALGLGLDCDEVEEEIAPVIAEEDVPGPLLVKKGQVAGIFQTARGFSDGREVVRLELTIAAGAEPAGDHLRIEGEPTIELEVKGGYPGDVATAWAVVNAVPSVVRSEPGLLTVLDLPAGR